MDMPLPFVLGCLHVGNRDEPWDVTMADLECPSGERVGLHRAGWLYVVLRFIDTKSGAAIDFLRLCSAHVPSLKLKDIVSSVTF